MTSPLALFTPALPSTVSSSMSPEAVPMLTLPMTPRALDAGRLRARGERRARRTAHSASDALPAEDEAEAEPRLTLRDVDHDLRRGVVAQLDPRFLDDRRRLFVVADQLDLDPSLEGRVDLDLARHQADVELDRAGNLELLLHRFASL